MTLKTIIFYFAIIAISGCVVRSFVSLPAKYRYIINQRFGRYRTIAVALYTDEDQRKLKEELLYQKKMLKEEFFESLVGFQELQAGIFPWIVPSYNGTTGAKAPLEVTSEAATTLEPTVGISGRPAVTADKDSTPQYVAVTNAQPATTTGIRRSNGKEAVAAAGPAIALKNIAVSRDEALPEDTDAILKATQGIAKSFISFSKDQKSTTTTTTTTTTSSVRTSSSSVATGSANTLTSNESEVIPKATPADVLLPFAKGKGENYSTGPDASASATGNADANAAAQQPSTVSAAAAAVGSPKPPPSTSTAATATTAAVTVKQLSPWRRLRFLLTGKGWSGKTVISKASMAAMGLNVLLAYGFVSNVSSITCLILAWVSHGRTYALSPLAPEQWKKFLLIYAGFFAANNILRPLRLSLSLALTPFFNNLIRQVQTRTKWNKTLSTGLVVFMVNVVGSISYMCLGLLCATRLAGVPLLP